jgi:hypothetical protein
MNYFLWALLLIVQNFSFTLVSRARNSGSLGFHALAAVGSNGVWFASNFILIDNVISIIKTADLQQAVFIGLFYTVFTVAGSLSSHYISMKYIEKGSRRVGSS